MRSGSSLAGFTRTRHGDASIRMAAFDRDFVEHMAHSLDFMPTSGFYGIMIALLRCAKVDVYGFHVTPARSFRPLHSFITRSTYEQAQAQAAAAAARFDTITCFDTITEAYSLRYHHVLRYHYRGILLRYHHVLRYHYRGIHRVSYVVYIITRC